MSSIAGVPDSPSAIAIRPYRPGDEAELNGAFERAFAVERDLAEWRWKFDESEGRRRVLLALDGSRIVAHYAAVPVRFQHPLRPLLGGLIVDVFCNRRLALGRRGGLFGRLFDEYLAEHGGDGRYDFLFGFPNLRHQRAGELAGFYPASIPIPVWRTSPFARRLGSTPGAGRLDGFDGSGLDALWRAARGRYRFAAVRDARRIAHRYVARPGVEYHFISIQDWGRPRAWAALRIERERLRWVDLGWDGERRRDFAALEAAVHDYAREAGAREVELWLHGDPRVAEELARLGWVSAPLAEGVCLARGYASDLLGEDLASALYFTSGDSDLV